MLAIRGCLLLIHFGTASVSEPGHYILDQNILSTFVFDHAQKYWLVFLNAFHYHKLLLLSNNSRKKVAQESITVLLSFLRKSTKEFVIKANEAPGGKIALMFVVYSDYKILVKGSIW